jgi:hypothetical protein
MAITITVAGMTDMRELAELFRRCASELEYARIYKWDVPTRVSTFDGTEATLVIDPQVKVEAK